MNLRRLEKPDLFTFSLPDATPESPLRWGVNKMDLAELLLALNHARVLRTPDGLIPTYTDIIAAFGRFFNMNIGEAANLSRRIRERDEKSKFLDSLTKIINGLT